MTATTFTCSAEIPLWDGHSFFVDGNSKVTRDNGTFAEPRPNAFSLPHIASCPGSTPACRASCYVHGLEKGAPDVYAKYRTNAAALHAALLDESKLVASAATLAAWINRSGLTSFRWHVSGDVMGDAHAKWIAMVCDFAPDVEFWIYTRTFHPRVIRHLAETANLALNISADRNNLPRAHEAWVLANSYKGARRPRLCYLTQDGKLPTVVHTDVIFPDYALRGRNLQDPTQAPWWQSLTAAERKKVCPADFFGQSEASRCGPCGKCL